MERILRAACVFAGLVVAGLSIAAVASASTTVPTAVYTHQGDTFSATSRIVSNASVCVFAQPGTTCTGGVAVPANIRSITVQNLGATTIWCDETSPAAGTNAAPDGIMLPAGGSLTLDQASRGAKLYCILGTGTSAINNITTIFEAK